MENTLFLIYIALSGYLVGSIPFGYLITRLAGKGDIRKQGSGNIGATNVTRSLGKTLGLITFVLDSFKALAFLVIAHRFFIKDSNIALTIAIIAPVIGHIFPIWLKFKGGKGVASIIAIIFYLSPSSCLILLIIWWITFKILHIVSIASIFSLFIVIMDVLIISREYSLGIIIICITSIAMHHSNFTRFLQGKELPFEPKKKKAKTKKVKKSKK
jgi:acyl phosphate:glycerol-3-phosphate acyltransferase